MRTQEEILQRIEDQKSHDFMGTITGDLIEFLNFDNAKPYLKEGVTAEEWQECIDERKSPREQMIDYMSFAFEKAWNERGISAARSIQHFQSWLWLDGNGTLADQIDNYTDYGKPQLRQICAYLGINPKDYGDE